MNLDDSNLLMDINDSFIFKESPIRTDDECILSADKHSNKEVEAFNKDQDDLRMADVNNFEADAKAEEAVKEITTKYEMSLSRIEQL